MKSEDKILKAAVKVYYQDASAPFDKIAEAAGVSRMTVHRKFPNRETLIVAACDRIFSEGIRLLDAALKQPGTLLEQLENFVKQSVKEQINYHFLYQFEPLHSLMNEKTSTAFYDSLEQLFKQLKAQQWIKEGVTEPWFFHLFDAIMMTAWHTHEHGCVAPNDIPDLAWNSLKGALIQS